MRFIVSATIALIALFGVPQVAAGECRWASGCHGEAGYCTPLQLCASPKDLRAPARELRPDLPPMRGRWTIYASTANVACDRTEYLCTASPKDACMPICRKLRSTQPP